MPKKVISVSDITAYLYCPRKLWLSKTQGIREPPNRAMILGKIKHRALELFNILERDFIINIAKKLDKEEIEFIYQEIMRNSALKAFQENAELAERLSLNVTTFLAEFLPLTDNEIKIRISPLLKAMQYYSGREIWENLSPKYKVELALLSDELGIKGRIDRVSFAENILPFELKTRGREEVYKGDKIQLAAYALLLEEKYKLPVNLGIVEAGNKKQEISLTKELKDEVLEIAEKVRNLQEEFPSNFAKCKTCFFKEECFK